MNFASLWADLRLRYFMVGGGNTAVGYVLSLGIYALLKNIMPVVGIGIVVNAVCITFSFLSYKILVFHTKGNWFFEYLRAWTVYGVGAVLAVAMLWFFMKFLVTPFWLAQGLCLIVTIVVSYFGHKYFTFRKGLAHARL